MSPRPRFRTMTEHLQRAELSLSTDKYFSPRQEGAAQPRTLSLFPEDHCEGLLPDNSIVRLPINVASSFKSRRDGVGFLYAGADGYRSRSAAGRSKPE